MTIPNYTNPHTWATGDAVPASTLNSNLRDNVAFLAAAKYVQLGLTANQSISNASWNTVNWSVANAETVEAWGASPYPDRISPQLAGYYQVTLFALWTANSTGYRASQLLFNGSSFGLQAKIEPVASLTLPLWLTWSIYFNGSSDYLACQVYQTSGGALDLSRRHRTTGTRQARRGSRPSRPAARRDGRRARHEHREGRPAGHSCRSRRRQRGRQGNTS